MSRQSTSTCLQTAHQVVLLVEDGDATMPDRPQWVAEGPGRRADTRSDQRLVRWMVDTWDLCRPRFRIASLDERNYDSAGDRWAGPIPVGCRSCGPCCNCWPA